LARVSEHLPAGQTPDARLETAIGIFGVLSGTLQLARVVADQAMSEKILESGIAAALKIAGLTVNNGNQS
jgi:hypothetical protein